MQRESKMQRRCRQQSSRAQSETTHKALYKGRFDEAEHDPIPFHLFELRPMSPQGFTQAE
jgi:hypothetical protein